MELILNELIEQYRDEIINHTKELVAMPSLLEQGGEGFPFGKPINNALERVLEIGESLGFEMRKYDGYAGTLQLGKDGKQIGVLAHIDVVPAGDGWDTPPFKPVVIDDKLYGRGSLDDKGPLIASLYAMKAIKESGLPMKNHVRAIIGTDEESGFSRGLKYYLTKEEGPWLGFSPDAEFPVIHAEKGILRFIVREKFDLAEKVTINDANSLKLVGIDGGIKVNIIPSTAVAYLSGSSEQLRIVENCFESYEKKKSILIETVENGIKVIAKGQGGHSSQPWIGENAIHILLDFLGSIPFEKTKEVAFAKKIQTLFGDGYRGENLGVACEDKLSGILTLSMGILKSDEKGGSATVEIRYPIHASCDVIKKTLSVACKENNLDLEIMQDKRIVYFPEKAPLVQKLWTAYKECTGREEPPKVIGGGTYCRFVDNVVAYGPVFPGQRELAHEPNEYISIEDLIMSAKIYAQAIYSLLNVSD